MPSERWLCLSISARKHSPSENAGLQGFLLAFLDNISPWGSSWKRSRPSVFSPRRFILQAFQHAFEFFILGKSSEVMLAADPILICQNMRSSDVIFRRLIDWQNFKLKWVNSGEALESTRVAGYLYRSLPSLRAEASRLKRRLASQIAEELWLNIINSAPHELAILKSFALNADSEHVRMKFLRGRRWKRVGHQTACLALIYNLANLGLAFVS